MHKRRRDKAVRCCRRSCSCWKRRRCVQIELVLEKRISESSLDELLVGFVRVCSCVISEGAERLSWAISSFFSASEECLEDRVDDVVAAGHTLWQTLLLAKERELLGEGASCCLGVYVLCVLSSGRRGLLLFLSVRLGALKLRRREREFAPHRHGRRLGCRLHLFIGSFRAHPLSSGLARSAVIADAACSFAVCLVLLGRRLNVLVQFRRCRCCSGAFRTSRRGTGSCRRRRSATSVRHEGHRAFGGAGGCWSRLGDTLSCRHEHRRRQRQTRASEALLQLVLVQTALAVPLATHAAGAKLGAA
eukprot:jgi/Phyca11/577571/estExt2_Genewise1.C_PHYCAscaffold_1430008